MFACRVWRDDGRRAPLCQPIAKPPGVIDAVRQQAAWSWNALQKLGHPCQVMRMAWRQAQRNGPPAVVGQGMNLGRPSAARSPDGLRVLPPFSHDAERCGLIEMLSALVVPTTPEEFERT